MDMLSRALEKLSDVIRDRPLTAVIGGQVTTVSLLTLLYLIKKHGSLAAAVQIAGLTVLQAAGGSAIIQAKLKEVTDDVEKTLLKETADLPKTTVMPSHGRSADDVLSTLRGWSDMETKHALSGRLSGAVYHGGKDLTEVLSSAYKMFMLSNPLHPDVFPVTRKLEAEVCAMVTELFRGGPKSCASVTSGGTESILMAMKVYRDMAFKERGVVAPEIVVPRTAHAAFDKACHYFGMKMVHVEVDPETFTVKVEDMAAAITKNTVALVGSAPQFPHGVIDPIEDIGKLAVKHKLPLHVDCCLGSFVIAFAEAAGHPVQRFDFSVEGVTSISCDTHKYGFSPKGTSIIMYSDTKYRQYQYFIIDSWPGGVYASPTMAGSRPGALSVAAWATLVHIGKDGYTRGVKKILNAARKIKSAINASPYLKVMGDPQLSVVAFGSAPGGPNVYAVADFLKERGWNLNMLQYPACVHLCVTYANADYCDDFIADIAAGCEAVMENPDAYASGSAAIYGMAAQLADRSMVQDIARAYIDTCYKA